MMPFLIIIPLVYFSGTYPWLSTKVFVGVATLLSLMGVAVSPLPLCNSACNQLTASIVTAFLFNGFILSGTVLAKYLVYRMKI
ncbi:hypothetical protein [Pseudoalteromonas rubra]|uniref:Uncharacterized protein n=1 Tax=Pseudoalteromonas rubra TaxID=43658 RepID=A0A5S3WZ42_9GAMM|nr:hypothetical protein [Pseudoalteromonas rubra]TMP37067.1 hypothetical protein CWB98_12245 [Pseudoalteromonas rubra]